MSKLKNNKGITLVALIITIIVLLILAMVSIRLVMNGGIIDRAHRGVKAYSDAEIQEQLKLAYQEYQMAKYSETGYTLQNALSKTGLDIISVEGNDSTGYEVKVNTKDGEKSYVLQANGTVGAASTEWTYDGHGTYTKGIKSVTVGQTVNYNEGTGYTFTADSNKGMYASVSYNGSTYTATPKEDDYITEDLTWKVLGVNSQGQIELISTAPHSVKVALYGEEAYNNAATELDNLCNALYGHGTGAAAQNGARSLKVTDINTLANYDPATDTANNSRYNTYRKYRFTSEGAYEYSDSTDGQTNWSDWTSIPSYYGVNSFRMIGSSNTLNASNPGETEAIKHTYYYYNAKTAITSAISESFANMLVDSNNNQWLASSCVGAGSPAAGWSVFYLGSRGVVGSYRLYSSDGGSYGYAFSVRPVVSLSSDISLEWNASANQWEIPNN